MSQGFLFSDCDPAIPIPEGLSYDPCFLTALEQIDLVSCIDAEVWSLELKRRVQQYGYRYDYKARRVDRSMHLGALPGFVRHIVAKLREHQAVAHEADQLIVNEYLPGQGISAHIDCEPCFEDRIAVISLGWAYEMEFQHSVSMSAATLMLAPGSLLVLSGPSRYEWTHQIRARYNDHGISRQRRVSLTFRKVLIEG